MFFSIKKFQLVLYLSSLKLTYFFAQYWGKFKQQANIFERKT
jgi:hypothetical protein